MKVPQGDLAPEDILEQVIEMTCPFPWLKELAEEGLEVYFNSFQHFVNADCLWPKQKSGSFHMAFSIFSFS